MTPDEIRTEVDRRRRRARDLRIPETLWHLEKSFRGYRVWLRDDPQFARRLVYPRIELLDDGTRLSLEQAAFQLVYHKGRIESDNYGRVESQTTYGTLTLRLNDDSVFEFDVAETIDYLPDSPRFSERLGEINRFIDGPWVDEIAEFALQVRVHEQRAWKERDAPRAAREAEELRKKFGL